MFCSENRGKFDDFVQFESSQVKVRLLPAKAGIANNKLQKTISKQIPNIKLQTLLIFFI